MIWKCIRCKVRSTSLLIIHDKLYLELRVRVDRLVDEIE